MFSFMPAVQKFGAVFLYSDTIPTLQIIHSQTNEIRFGQIWDLGLFAVNNLEAWCMTEYPKDSFEMFKRSKCHESHESPTRSTVRARVADNLEEMKRAFGSPALMRTAGRFCFHAYIDDFTAPQFSGWNRDCTKTICPILRYALDTCAKLNCLAVKIMIKRDVNVTFHFSWHIPFCHEQEDVAWQP